MSDKTFIKMLQYKEKEGKTQLENYITELFVFILEYLISKNDIIANNILYEFGFNNKTDFKSLSIYTQKTFYAGDTKVIPDIVIEDKSKITIIEVKVDSEINHYTIDNHSINQIELYKKIDNVDKNVKNVFLLTKKIVVVDNLEKDKIKLWSSIYDFLKSSKDFVIKKYLVFLEEYEMSSVKLTPDVLNLVETAKNFQLLIKESWGYDEYKLSFSRSIEWIGCYVKYPKGKNKKNRNLFWIGQYKSNPEIIFKIEDEIFLNKLLKHPRGIVDDYGIVSKKSLKELIKQKDGNKQKEMLKEWFVDIMENILKDFV